ncbi:MAG: hypothetical protein JWM16_4976, partial [Verrucomicrobiales bacterium]|nr:hypothetical protein [Verrucomicrobiales bacterium]
GAGSTQWLAPAPDGSVWAVGAFGLGQITNGSLRVHVLGGNSVFPDSSGCVWVGGKSLGVLKGKIDFDYGMRAGLTNGIFAPVHEDEAGAVWILSSERGIFRAKNGRLINISSKQGLLSDLNLCLLDDGLGRYWFNCYKGIYWVRRDELNEVADGKRERLSCVAYGVEDGLPSLEGNGGNSPNGCKARDGTLWFPTTKGVAIIDPQATLADDIPPPVAIEEVRCDSEIVSTMSPLIISTPTNGMAACRSPGETRHPTSAELQLSAGRGRSIVIAYSSPSFIAPERTRYRYQLEGQDKDWVDAQGQPFVQFAGLKPGHYRFRVTACNYRGVWNPVGAQLAFFIAPFFYQTWAFYGMCAAGVLGVGGGIQAYRLSMQRRILGLEREAALAKERERIARDMHDDLGASLTRIARLSEMAKFEGGEMPRRLEKISTAAGELVDSIGELVWATNPKYDHLESMVAYFREYTAQHFEGAGIQCHVDFPEAVPAASVSADFRRQLFLVLKEALQNVTKHAQAKDVWVSLKISGEQLRLEVRDNGKGMDCKESPDFHHGLSNMRERVRLLGGKLEINSGLGKGTAVKAAVPLSVR